MDMNQENMRCIDFDGAFARYLSAWMRAHEGQYDMDEIEDRMPDIYAAFLQEPAPWLGGLAPGAYFERFDDAAALVRLLCAYIENNTPVPDLLLERIVTLGEEAPLLALLGRRDIPPEAEKAAISLLREMQSAAPMQAYIDFIAAMDAPDEMGDLRAEALLSMGRAIVEPILRALPDAGDVGLDIFADLLSHYPGDARIFDLILARFERAEEKRALFAACLSKLGDERALPALCRAAKQRDIRYLDFMEIANAIEALGGERPQEREFSGDTDYEALRLL